MCPNEPLQIEQKCWSISLKDWSSACHTLPQNLLLDGKNKIAGAAPTKVNNTPAVSRASTIAVAPLIASIFSHVAQYLEDDLQRIIKIGLDFKLSAHFLAPIPAFQQLEGLVLKHVLE